jgi:hypothetical protein
VIDADFGYYEFPIEEFVGECHLCARPLRDGEVCKCDPEDEK